MLEEKLHNAKQGLLDFHMHSTVSDGADSPAQIVLKAKEKGITAMALTDHNLIAGLDEFNSASKEQGIFTIPFGVEIYAELPSEILGPEDNDAPDMVVLGKSPKVDEFKEYSRIYEDDRMNRYIPETLDKLRKVGFDIPLQEICRDEALGVPKIFHEFIHVQGNFERFVKYLHDVNNKIPVEEIEKQPVKFINKYIYAIGRPAYARRIMGFGLGQAVQLAEAMNCKLLIAHPGGEYGFLSDQVLDYYISQGVHGIETRNYFNTPEQNEKFDCLAQKHNLLRSGGSDYHGKNGPFRIGSHDKPRNQIPKEILEELWFGLPS